MKPDTALTFWWLSILTKRRYDALKQVFNNLDDALSELSIPMLRELGLKEEAAQTVMARLDLFNIDRYREEMQKQGVELLSIEDDAYPSRLREAADAPLFLSYKGDLSILSHPLLGIVGTRAMSRYGRRVVSHFVPGLVRAGIVTVSGLALGVDAAVAKETMIAHGKTVAVLGGGLATIYPPSNKNLASEIVAYGGLLLSEFPLEYPPDKYTFPARNRIIAGLTEGTLICEAPTESGSIITADLALDYNRLVFAVPGSIFEDTYTGCHELISEGHAKLVTKPEDILLELGMIVPESPTLPAYVPNDADEAALYTVLTGMPLTTDDLVERTGLHPSYISSALTMLELKGVVRNIGGGQWVRS
jgi:DNA processing protein